MQLYEMHSICSNMYKWGVQMDVGGAITEEPNFLPFSSLCPKLVTLMESFAFQIPLNCSVG